ncbi:hypothetical protein RhiLY_01762 [Ceratobasidium sp. AG-Ba]|nr:hypothetical protein RhiLY_01762 [Ceratobasidium sp. AG-Ba]
MASPDKRTSVKTSKYKDWKADITKTQAKSDMIARGKNVRAEEEELAAQEEDAEYTEESPVKKAPKPKGKAPAKQAAPCPKSPPGDGDANEDDEEARNLAQVKADEKRCLELQFKIYARDKTSIEKLMTMDLPELEEIWEKDPAGAGSGKAKGLTAKGKKSTAPAKKDSAAPPKKAPSKTPARVRVTKPGVSKVTALASPLVAFKQARDQSILADSTPVPVKRTRDPSLDHDTDIRRQRLDFAKSGISRMSAPINRVTSVDKSATTTTTSRAGSMAPSTTSARSQLSAPSKSASRSGMVVDDDREFFDLNIGRGEAEDEIEEVRPAMPQKKGAKIKKDPKPRPKKRDYVDDPEKMMIIDRTVEETIALLVPDMCCDELDIPIRRGWTRALKFLHQPPEQWPIDLHAINVCKTLISGFRSRGRQNQIQNIISHFGLQHGPNLDIEEVKEMAKQLLPTEFHRDPDAIGPNAGHYRNSILARGIAAIWMTGNKPTATRFPDVLDPVPTPSIAYVAAMSQDILKRVAKDGCIKVEKKAKTDEEREEILRERAAAKARGEGGTRANVDPVRADMVTHLENLQLFEQIMGPEYHEFRSNLFKDACKWAGIHKTEPQMDNKKPNASGKLTAASFADELKQAKARQAAVASGSRSDPQPNHKSLAKSPAGPTPSSKPPRIQEGLDENPSTGHPSARHFSPSEFDGPPSPMPQRTNDMHEEEGAPSDDESGEEEEGRQVPGSGPAKEDETEAEGDAQELDDTRERESTSPSAGKRKSRKEEAGCGDYDEPPSENEEPLKKRRLRKAPQAAVPQSDEEDQGEPQDDAGGDGGEPTTPAKALPSDTSPMANNNPPPGGTVPSSPLSEYPDDSPAAAKRMTCSSSQVAQNVLSAEEAMLAALAKRRQEEAEKRERAAQKKQEQEDARKAEEVAFQDLERQVKGAKPASGKTKPGPTKRTLRKKT